jgi:hypothetical protein
LWHFLNNNDITRLEQEEMVRELALNDLKPSTVAAANSSNKYSFGINNKQSKNNNNASNITIYKYNSDQLE